MGAIEKKEVLLTNNSNLQKLFINSISKLDSIVNIVNGFVQGCLSRGKKILEIEYTILSCSNNRYDIFSHSTFDKISNIYDLGSFETSGDAEVAAQNTNISANANYSVLKYYSIKEDV